MLVRAAPANWEMCGVSLMSNADSGAGRSNEAGELENIQWRWKSYTLDTTADCLVLL